VGNISETDFKPGVKSKGITDEESGKSNEEEVMNEGIVE